MGQLPASRVNPAPAFFNTGIDYAGPFFIKGQGGRRSSPTKAYVCLFVCLAIKAVHLEIVLNLTSEAFIAALRRFTSRRGLPRSIYSDNATTFQGAQHELRDLKEFLANECNKSAISSHAVSEGIEWHFIPPRSPHFGGIWEAGIKRLKFHLKRSCKDVIFSIDEFQTLLTQVEAIMNSRPLTPLSNDPNDFAALTPSHFLIGRPLTAPPDPSLEDWPTNRLSRFQLVQQRTQRFWKRWRSDYLTELQVQRGRKPRTTRDVTLGALVIIKEDGTPPLTWPLGRIVQVHPGSDGVIRVVTVLTNSGTYKRGTCRVCPLPID